MKIKVFAIAVLVLFCAPSFASKVIGVLDGDTIVILENGKPFHIRLANIDAPEKSQAFGQASKKSLSDLCYAKDAQYAAEKHDKYGRTIATVTCDGVEANLVQVQRGYAWVYTKYNLDKRLPALEADAKANHIGLWKDPHPTPPWEFRHRDQTSATEDESGCFTGPKGGKFRIVNGIKRYGC
jgi:micrococcal nuclease